MSERLEIDHTGAIRLDGDVIGFLVRRDDVALRDRLAEALQPQPDIQQGERDQLEAIKELTKEIRERLGDIDDEVDDASNALS